MFLQYRFFSNHGHELADVLTVIRIFIIFQILYLSVFSTNQFSYNTILFWLLIGWITDELDGRLARVDKSKILTWCGRNERKIDLFLVGAAHLYISRFAGNEFFIYLLGLLGIIAFLLMYRTGDADLFLQMVYITIISGYIIIMSIIENQIMWVLTMIYFLILILLNWNEFKGRVVYFVSFGRNRFE